MSNLKNNLLDRLTSAEAADRLALLCDEVRDIIRDMFDITKETPLDIDRGFFDLGLDSVTAVQLKDRLQSAFEGKIKLQSEDVFDHPTIKMFSAFMLDQLKIEWTDAKSKKTGQTSSQDNEDVSIEEEISGLTEEDILKELNKESENKK